MAILINTMLTVYISQQCIAKNFFVIIEKEIVIDRQSMNVNISCNNKACSMLAHNVEYMYVHLIPVLILFLEPNIYLEFYKTRHVQFC